MSASCLADGDPRGHGCPRSFLSVVITLLLANVIGSVGAELPALTSGAKLSAEEAPVAVALDAKYHVGELRWNFDPPLEFSDPTQTFFVDAQTMAKVSRKLDGIKAMTVGGWFFCSQPGEQVLFCRGAPAINAAGERHFPPSDGFVSFCLGTDQHGFFYGAIHGNGQLPFPHVTLSAIQANTWNQLVAVKDKDGYQKFYHNGVLARTDQAAFSSGHVRPFRETGTGIDEPIRLGMPRGGRIGEAWIYPGELSAGEIEADFATKKGRYQPAPSISVPPLREMEFRPSAWLWPGPISLETWPGERERMRNEAWERLGDFPEERVPLQPRVLSEIDCGHYLRRKVSIVVQPGDRMPAYLLIPKKLKGRVPAIICMYGVTSGAGKETTVGLSGRAPGSPPEKNLNFGVDMVEAGFVVFAPDYLRDGERIKPGEKPYDSTSFRRRFPRWSVPGKDVWDNMRAVDYLQSLEFVDPEKIGMTGHSYGGVGTIFAAAFDPRIKVAVASGPVSGSSPGFSRLMALVAPRPLLVGQAIGDHRPGDEASYAAARQLYGALGAKERGKFVWQAGDRDYPPELRRAAIDWFQHWFNAPLPE